MQGDSAQQNLNTAGKQTRGTAYKNSEDQFDDMDISAVVRVRFAYTRCYWS